MLQCIHSPMPGHGTTHSKWWYLNRMSGSRKLHVGQSARVFMLLKINSAPKPTRNAAKELASTCLNNEWKNVLIKSEMAEFYLETAKDLQSFKSSKLLPDA